MWSFFIAAIVLIVFGKKLLSAKERKDQSEMAIDCSSAKKSPAENAIVSLAFAKLPDHWFFGIPRIFGIYLQLLLWKREPKQFSMSIKSSIN